MQQRGLAFVALAVCAALHVSEAILPIASSCCTEVSHHISRRLLERVNMCRIQRADGDCDLAAVMVRSFNLSGYGNTVYVEPAGFVTFAFMSSAEESVSARTTILLSSG
ncbi:C-C motif chemokine 28 isoform X2 [Gorilla gorilla gorilla]|uniref:C-C motif chemokine 28 isoform X2 n=1 Tax=Gorilla gorilla gorilla TaxID=9595 RepID=UPI0030095B8D